MPQSLAHRRKHIRLKEYDYSQAGAYFVTICTKDRAYRFGEIVNGTMQANSLVAVVRLCWNDLPNHYPNVELDEFVIMPNHVHGIIILLDDLEGAASRRPNAGAGKPRPCLGNVVAYFKYQTAKRINELNGTPDAPFWQRGYYDHIVRTDRSLTQIREYIAHNPRRWGVDKENHEHEGNDELEGWITSTGVRHVQDATR